jgi:lauroyl/myristoyl acyltransferase
MTPTRPKKIAAANIALCWPELTAAQQHTLTRKSLAETGKTLFEAAPRQADPAPDKTGQWQ